MANTDVTNTNSTIFQADGSKSSPLEISGEKNRGELLPKNKFNEKETYSEALATLDTNSIDVNARVDLLNKNTYNDKKSYPQF